MIFSKQTTFIGLDINTTHLKWLQVGHRPVLPNRKVITIKNYGKIDFIEKNDMEFPETLNSLIEAQAFTHGQVGISLKEPAVQTAHITLPANLPTRAIKQLLREKASNLFHQPINNLSFHYQVLRSPKYLSELNFLIAVIEKQTIQTWVTYFRKSPLNLKIIDMSVFATARGEKVLSQQNFSIDPKLDQTNFLNQINLFTTCLGLACIHDKW